MKTLTPHHVGESEAANRSIKAGWYVVRDNGSVQLGPFLSREECLTEIEKTEPRPRPGLH